MKDSGDILNEIKKPRDWLIFALLIETGCNVSELSKIKISHIDTRKGRIIFPKNNTKNNERRIIRISDSLKSELEIYMTNNKNGGFLFRSRQSPALSSRRIEQIIGSYQTLHGKVTPRYFRRRYLAQALKRYPGDEELKKKTGLRNITRKKTVDLKRIRKLDFSSMRDELILLILAETGCRVSELISLRKKDVLGTSLEVGRPKRRVKVSVSLIRKINDFTQKLPINNYIISQKKKLTQRRVQQIVKSYSESLNSEISPSIIRNSYIHESYHDQVQKNELKKMLGIRRIDLFTHGLI